MRLESLLRAARAGQPDAWEQLAKALTNALRAYFRRFGPSQDVDDLVQKVIVVALERLAGLESQASLEGWIFGVALNVWREGRRARDRDARLGEQLIVWPSEPGPSTALGQAELIELLEREIEKLPARLREIIEHDLAELDRQALADRRGVTRSTLRSQRSGANKVLRARLEHLMKTPESTVSKLTDSSTPPPT